MKGSHSRRALWRVPLLLGSAFVAVAGLTGCQVDVGGQTLPSPYYMSDDVQYFPPGPEFRYQREADAMKARVAPPRPAGAAAAAAPPAPVPAPVPAAVPAPPPVPAPPGP